MNSRHAARQYMQERVASRATPESSSVDKNTFRCLACTPLQPLCVTVQVFGQNGGVTSTIHRVHNTSQQNLVGGGTCKSLRCKLGCFCWHPTGPLSYNTTCGAFTMCRMCRSMGWLFNSCSKTGSVKQCSAVCFSPQVLPMTYKATVRTSNHVSKGQSM